MSSQVRTILICIALVALTAYALWPVTRAGFIRMDDDEYVLHNPLVTGGPSLAAAKVLLTHTHENLYHPLSLITFMFDYAAFGPSPAGYHRVNLAIHLASCVLLFLLLQRMTGAVWRSAAAAALFAIHPLRVESVAWVSERKDALSLLFALAALAAYVRWARLWERPRRAAGFGFPSLALYLLMVGLLVLSLLAKPTLVTFPLLLLILDFWPLGRLPLAGGLASIGRRLGARVLEKLPLFALVGAWSAMITLGRIGEAPTADSGFQPPAMPIPSLGIRLQQAPISVVLYLWKHVDLMHLAIPYPPHEQGWPIEQVAGAWAVLGLISAAALWQYRRRPWLLAGWAWFVVALLPLLAVVSYIGDYAMADRYTYVADVGLVMAVVWSVPASLAQAPAGRAALVGATAVALVTLACFSRAQAGYWRDDQSLFGHSIAVTEGNSTAFAALAMAASQAHDYRGAIDLYEQAVKFSPDETLYSACGSAHARLGDFAGAVDCYGHAMMINPAFPEAHYNLAILLKDAGDIEDAQAELQAALEIRPSYRAAQELFSALATFDPSLKTVEQCRSALALHPDNAMLHAQLARLLDDKGNIAEAIEQYNASLQLNPAQPATRVNLGYDLAATGKRAQAMEQYRQALAVSPHSADAHLNLGSMLIEMNDLLGAAGEIKLALVSRPDYVEAYDALGYIAERIGQRESAALEYRRALNFRPNDADAQAGLRRVRGG